MRRSGGVRTTAQSVGSPFWRPWIACVDGGADDSSKQTVVSCGSPCARIRIAFEELCLNLLLLVPYLKYRPLAHFLSSNTSR